jgi:hypothetical protein
VRLLADPTRPRSRIDSRVFYARRATPARSSRVSGRVPPDARARPARGDDRGRDRAVPAGRAPRALASGPSDRAGSRPREFAPTSVVAGSFRDRATGIFFVPISVGRRASPDLVDTARGLGR